MLNIYGPFREKHSMRHTDSYEHFEQTLLLAFSQLEKTEVPVNTGPTHVDAAEMCSFADAASLA